MNFFLINLLTVSLFLLSLISCIGSRNILPGLPFGHYQLIYKQIKSCNVSQENKIQNNFYLFHNPKSNVTEIRGNMTNSIPVDDTLFLEANFAVRDERGNWIENAFTHKSPKACSAYKNLMGDEWTRFMNGLGVNIVTCPLAPGIYIAPGLDTSIFTKNTNFPKSFFYGTYKLRFFYSRDKEIYGCNIYILEIKPV